VRVKAANPAAIMIAGSARGRFHGRTVTRTRESDTGLHACSQEVCRAGLIVQVQAGQVKWTSCALSKKYKNLKVGKHKLRVYAIDAAGNVDASAAVWKWRVKC